MTDARLEKVAQTPSFHREREALTEAILGCALEVHRTLGPGLLESIYEAALSAELSRTGLKSARQTVVPVPYKGEYVGDYRVDLIVEDAVVVEVKSVEKLDPVFEAQVLTYLRVSGKHGGLLINFNSKLLKDGIRRFVL